MICAVYKYCNITLHYITATLIASLDRVSTNNWLLRANGYCSFLDRWIADSSSWIFQNSSFLDSWSLILDSRLSILLSRNSNVSTFTTREWSFEDQVETVNLPLSGTVCVSRDFKIHNGGVLLRQLWPSRTRATTANFTPNSNKWLRFLAGTATNVKKINKLRGTKYIVIFIVFLSLYI